MDENDKWCIICCLPFVLNGQSENDEKISQFWEEIRKDIGNGKKGTLNRFDFCEELVTLDKCFKLSICLKCLTEATELLKSKQSMNMLEKHVILLQMEIVKGLRDLEKCMEKIKYHEENIKKTIDVSDELSLKKRLGSEWKSNNLALKLREWLAKDAQTDKGKVKGNLWISSGIEERAPEQTSVKVEIEDSCTNFDDNVSNDSWGATDDIDEKFGITTVITPCQSSKRRTARNFKARKTCTMTLRTRNSRKPDDDIPKPYSKPSLSEKPKRKGTQKDKKILKPILKNAKARKRVHVPRVKRKCDLCSFSTREVPSFEQHMRLHETETDNQSKSLQCPNCPSKFSTQQFFNFHQNCHNGLYKLQCDVCFKLIMALSLEDHLKSHISSEGKEMSSLKIIYCQNCSFCCTSRQTYLNHLHRHKSKKTSGKFTCDICSEEFSMPKNLLDHFQEKHEGALEKLTCDFPNCGKEFPTKSYLIAHKFLHSKEKNLPCPFCGKKFARNELLKAHVKIHTDEKPFKCNLCDERFRWTSGLHAHQRNEHGAAKLKCEECGKEFIEKRRLIYHMKEVHGNGNERFPCKICGNLFKRKYYLKVHMISVHGEDNKYTCEQCGKGFRTEWALKGHLKVHSGVKNLKCEYCGKAFLRKENLRDHLRIHTGERPYVCEICGKDFNQASALKIHKKNQHAN